MADAATSTSGSQLPRKRNRKPKSASSDAIQAEKGATSEVKPKKNEKERQKERLKSNALKRRKQDEELTVLQKSVDEFVPPSIIDAFSLLPLSSRTLLGLKSSHFTTPTPIQALSLPASLKNNDILGSARTGSGKTLAFLIPVLERLYRERWGPMDGLGAVVISPTRELAIQTFQALRSIGQHHTFSAGLIIGGKPLQEERDRLSRMNILIATPGRLLQHFDSTVGLETSQVKVLVLDEADRLMDLGFAPTLKAIVNHLGPSSTYPAGTNNGRQTLLFSATQSPDLMSLAKLSLKSPMYINVNKPGEEGVMPAKLEQYYSVVPLERKLDALWGFVKSHLKMKGVVFVSSCKQVRFVFETFRKLHPGLPLMHLHGKQKQPTRLDIFQRFSSSSTALLICTDIASRGLDFPAVDWVVQLDCPEDVDMYIHRVGRTARYMSEGKGLAILLPSEEEGMKTRWQEKGIEVKQIKIKENKMGNLTQQLQSFAFRDPEIKYLGQRAFISYLKSIHIQKDKSVFDLSALPIEEYAASLGLPGAPQIKFIDAAKMKGKKNAARADQAAERAELKEKNAAGEIEEETVFDARAEELAEESESDEEEMDSDAEEEDEEDEEVAGLGGKEAELEKPESEAESDQEGSGSDDGKVDKDEKDNKPSKSSAVRTKFDRMFERKNQSVLTAHYSGMVRHDDQQEADDDDDFLTIGQRNHTLADVGLGAVEGEGEAGSSTTALSIPSAELSKRKLKMGESKKAMLKMKGTGHKIQFDDEGGAHEVYEMQGLDEFEGKGDAARQREEYVKEEMEKMKEADIVDRQVAREKRLDKKRKRKEREREEMEEAMGEAPVLGGSDDEDDEDEAGQSGDEDEEEEEEEEEEQLPARKKAKRAASPDIEDDEEALALRLLQG